MTIQEMHYDFKQKLNKLDSQNYRNLKVPEIDWKLNEAIELYVKTIAEPKYKTIYGFEKNQVISDNIRPLVVASDNLTITDGGTIALPDDYGYFIAFRDMKIKGVENNATEVSVEKFHVVQHNDDSNSSFLDNSSLLWREVNFSFEGNNIVVELNGFTVESCTITYLKEHPIVANPSSYPNGSYKDLNGKVIDTNQNCILPDNTHREIVDLAVAITAGDLENPNYKIARDKLGLDQL